MSYEDDIDFPGWSLMLVLIILFIPIWIPRMMWIEIDNYRHRRRRRKENEARQSTDGAIRP